MNRRRRRFAILALALSAAAPGAVTLQSSDPIGGILVAITAVILVAIVGGLYFLPAILAHQRGHRNLKSTLVINVFLGWTLVGWVICLAWALADQESAA